jgi:hypothetical protein
MRFDGLVFFFTLTSLFSVSAFGQAILAARSGMVNFSEGEVYIGEPALEQPLEQKTGKFTEIKEGNQLRTAIGRAEILLTPGVIVRVGPDSAVRMNSTSLIDTRVELRFGSAMVEVAEDPKDTMVTIAYRDYTVRFPKRGVFRIDSSPAQVLVFEGQAEVGLDDQKKIVAANHRMPLTRALAAESFHQSVGDGLYEWTLRRTDQLAADNPPPGDLSGSFDPGMGIGSLGLGSAGIGTMPMPSGGGWYNNSPYGFTPYYSPGWNAWNFGYGSPFGVYSAMGLYPYGLYPYALYGSVPGYGFGRGFHYPPPTYTHLPGYRPPVHQPFAGTSGMGYRPPSTGYIPAGRAPAMARPAGVSAPRGATARGK